MSGRFPLWGLRSCSQTLLHLGLEPLGLVTKGRWRLILGSDSNHYVCSPSRGKNTFLLGQLELSSA